MHSFSSQFNKYIARSLRWTWSIRLYISCTPYATYFAETQVPCKRNVKKGKTNKISMNVEKTM